MHIDSALRVKAGGRTPYPSVPSLGSYTCFGGMGVTLIRELALSLRLPLSHMRHRRRIKADAAAAAHGGGAGAVAAAADAVGVK